MKPLLLLLLALWAPAVAAQSAERWQRLMNTEAALAREMTRVDLIIGYNPFGAHVQRIQAAYPDPRLRARAAAAADLKALDGKAVTALPIRQPAPSTTMVQAAPPPAVKTRPPPAATMAGRFEVDVDRMDICLGPRLDYD